MTDYYQFETHYGEDYAVKTNPDLDVNITFIGGKLITTPLPELSFGVNFPQRSKPPHLLGDIIPLASEDLIKALEAAGINNFQTFPALLTNPDTGEQWNNYFAFNALDIVRAVDLNASNYDTIMGGDESGTIPPLVAFRSIVLDQSRIRDLMMFRLAESPDGSRENGAAIEKQWPH